MNGTLQEGHFGGNRDGTDSGSGSWVESEAGQCLGSGQVADLRPKGWVKEEKTRRNSGGKEEREDDVASPSFGRGALRPVVSMLVREEDGLFWVRVPSERGTGPSVKNIHNV